MLKSTERSRREIRIGPKHAGRRMRLRDFEEAIGEEGYIYELNKGVIECWGVPPIDHFFQMSAIRDQLIFHKETNRTPIHAVAGAADVKILLEEQQSERHPDIAVYLSTMPDTDDIWSIWIPTIVFEIISEDSRSRDYEDKPLEYLAAGVQEYCIVDARNKELVALTRCRGGWRNQVFGPQQKYTTRHLPGFSLDLKRVLSAGK